MALPPCCCRCHQPPPESSAHVSPDDIDGVEVLEQPPGKRRQMDPSNIQLERDPGKRPQISTFPRDAREIIRRRYLVSGPFQVDGVSRGSGERRFMLSWCKDYDWLEYSPHSEAAFCLPCFVMGTPETSLEKGSKGAFVVSGFRDFKKVRGKDCRLLQHHNSKDHLAATQACAALLNTRADIRVAFENQSQQVAVDNRKRLSASIDVVRFLARQGLAFRGHDEGAQSSNQGNFLELLKLLATHNDDLRTLLQSAPDNNKYSSPDSQKEITRSFAALTLQKIREDVGGAKFSLLLDESADVSQKEQLSVIIRFVDNLGLPVERFLGLFHLRDTCADTLWKAVQTFLESHGLSVSNIRGQGYDGASNMRGEYNGLKALVLAVNKFAYFIHCFNHQLQLALVSAAKESFVLWQFFSNMSCIINVAGASCKRRDHIREQYALQIAEELQKGVLETGRGQHQELGVKRAGDTRWSSHYAAVLNLLRLFDPVIDVLEDVKDDGSAEQQAEATGLLKTMQSYEFCLCLHLCKSMLGITNTLSQSLQRQEQDIVNAMNLVTTTKKRLRDLRADGWQQLHEEVAAFCQQHGIAIPIMDEAYSPSGRPRRNQPAVSNDHHYRISIFNTVLDYQLQELDNRFAETTTELLKCMSCFDPCNSFQHFHVDQLCRLADFYSADFTTLEKDCLVEQSRLFIDIVRSHFVLSNPKVVYSLVTLSRGLVQFNMHVTFPLVFRLLTLVLTLPVSTAAVERSFSGMKFVKNRLRNRISDQWISDLLVCFVESDVSDLVDNEKIVEYYSKISTRRGRLV